jgi:ABC-type dipeptide/oligopeptide/nickel transport system permease subunit
VTVGYLGLPVEGLEWIIVVVGVVLPAAAGAVSGSAGSRRLRFAAAQSMLPWTLAWIVLVAPLGWGMRAIHVFLVDALPPALFFACFALAAWLRRRADRSLVAVQPPVPPAGPP